MMWCGSLGYHRLQGSRRRVASWVSAWSRWSCASASDRCMTRTLAGKNGQATGSYQGRYSCIVGGSR